MPGSAELFQHAPLSGMRLCLRHFTWARKSMLLLSTEGVARLAVGAPLLVAALDAAILRLTSGDDDPPVKSPLEALKKKNAAAAAARAEALAEGEGESLAAAQQSLALGNNYCTHERPCGLSLMVSMGLRGGFCERCPEPAADAQGRPRGRKRGRGEGDGSDSGSSSSEASPSEEGAGEEAVFEQAEAASSWLEGRLTLQNFQAAGLRNADRLFISSVLADLLREFEAHAELAEDELDPHILAFLELVRARLDTLEELQRTSTGHEPAARVASRLTSPGAGSGPSSMPTQVYP